jgi:hypothetical protein
VGIACRATREQHSLQRRQSAQRRRIGAVCRSSFFARSPRFIQLGPQAAAVLHADQVAGFREPIEQGAGQVIVHQEGGRIPTQSGTERQQEKTNPGFTGVCTSAHYCAPVQWALQDSNL